MTWLGLVSSGRSPHLYVFSSDRGPWCKGLVPPCHVPEENSTFLRKTLPYLSMLLYCFSTAVSASASRRKEECPPFASLCECNKNHYYEEGILLTKQRMNVGRWA